MKLKDKPVVKKKENSVRGKIYCSQFVKYAYVNIILLCHSVSEMATF